MRRLRRNLLRTVALPTMGLVVVFSVGTALLQSELLEEVHDSAAAGRAGRSASVVARRITRASSGRGHAGLGELLVVVCESAQQGAFVAAADGRVRWACDRRLLGTRLGTTPPATAERVVHDGARFWRAVRPVVATDGCTRCHRPAARLGYVGVDVPLAHAEEEGRRQLQASFGAGIGLAVVLSLVLVSLQVLLVTRPLKRLAAVIERIRAGDLGARVAAGRDDEIGQLGASLNEMSASLARARDELDRTYRAELAQSEKLAALGQLFTSNAHELKNQLAGITGALRVLASETLPDDPNHAIVQKILARTERMTQTAVTALEFAKPLTPAITRVDLADLLDRTLFFVERQAAAQGVTLRKRYARDLAPAEVDEGLMRQVFLNILLNGVQAMPRGGTLEVATHAAGPGAVEVRVSDQGMGIAPEHRERLFSPFFSTKPSGTGLGLYIARQIVETQRGEIRVESAPGVGTTFVIRLPARPDHTQGGEDVAA